MIHRKSIFSFSALFISVFLPGILLFSSASAQHLGLKKYTVDDGLVQSEVISIFQDSKGFIWAGTKFGVSRFDGNKFVTRFDTLGILKSSVRFIAEIAKGDVIASSSVGYVVFEPNGLMKEYKYPIYNPGSTVCNWTSEGHAYVAFILPHDIEIYEILPGGMVNASIRYNTMIKALKAYDVLYLDHDEKNNCFYFTDFNQRTFCLFNSKVTRINIPHCRIYTKGLDGSMYVLAAINNLRYYKDSDTNNFKDLIIHDIGITHGLYRLNKEKAEKILEFNSSKPSYLSYFSVSSEGKIMIPDPGDRRLALFENGKWTIAKLNFNGISSAYFDNENTMWIGSANGLIHIFPEYLINYSSDEGLFPNTQSLVADTKGRIWVGSYENGLQYYSDGRFIKQELPNPQNSDVPITIYPGSRMDHKGRIHFGIAPYFMMTWDGVKMEIDKKWPSGAVLYFFDDTIAKEYLYGSTEGLVAQKYGQKDFSIQHVPIGPNTNSSIVSIMRSSNQKLLLGGFKAVMLYDGHSFEKLPNSKYPDIPGANAMAKDSKGHVWIGNGNGIYYYDNKKFKKIENDFFNDLVLSLQCIDTSRLLIGGIRGIGILDLNKFYKSGQVSIRYFDKNNGFIGGECQQNCITRDGEGFYWIGASNGIVRFDASAIPDYSPAPRVYLTHVYTNDEQINWNSLSDIDFGKGEIHLSYLSHNIRFEFTGIYFTAPDNIKFSFILEGFDKNWSRPGTDRSVSYTNLPPGKYTFKVRAINDAGTWSDKTAEFRVYAVAAFWQTWYFYLFVGIVILVVIIIGTSHFLSRRTRLVKEHFMEERRFAELQFKTLRNQLAPHFVFNALNAIGSSIYQNEKEKSYDFLQRFASLIRATLVHADKSYRTLNEELEFVRNYLDLEQFRFENKFEYSIQIQKEIDPDILVPKMIIQTFAENAVKHGLIQKSGKGLLSILLKTEPDCMEIIVEDNGIGRIESMKYNSNSTGRGMEIINEFITLFNRFNEKKIHFDVFDIYDDSGKIAGTRVIIKLPIDFTYNQNFKKQ